ncbi:hypothetical protein SCA6_018158 [Theobroma cacao]
MVASSSTQHRLSFPLLIQTVPVQVTFSHDAILVSSTLHQIPLAMLVSLFRITLVVCFLFCCLSMASKI